MNADNLLDAEHNTVRSASYLVSLRINYSDLDTFSAHLSKLTALLEKHFGFESIDVIHQDDGQGIDIFCIARFKSKEHLETWKLSPSRKIVLAPIEALSVVDVARQQACGSNIWFEPIVNLPSPHKPPLLWKRWAVSLLAVYPALVILIYLLKPIISIVPEPLGLLVVATILTGLTTAFIAPWLTKKLHKWLINN